MTTQKWLQQNTERLDGRTVAISGATGGLGRELVFLLASLGADLILLDRNREKSAALGDEVMERFPACRVRLITVDMEDMEAVKYAADALEADLPDYLILNAGAYHIPRHLCSTGLDNVYQINFVSPYYLARRLLPLLRARGGKVVAVGSIAHTYTKFRPDRVDFADCQKSSKAYGNAKRQLMFALWGLAERGEGLAITHPGITLTGITAHYPKVIYALIKHPMKIIFMKPRRACLCILRGLFADCERNEWIGPRFFGVWGLPKKTRLRTCSEEESEAICQEAERLWESLREENGKRDKK